MDFPDALGPREPDAEPKPEHIMSGAAVESRSYAEDSAAMVVPHATHAADRASADVISLETMRSSLATNFEPDDLDVPAFLRKRNDVM